MSQAVAILDSQGREIFPDSWAQTFAYNGDGTINYVEATSGSGVWRQTYTYTAGKVSAISAWVKQ